MLFEKNEIEELTKDIDETSASLVAFLEERLKLSSPKYVENNGHPLMAINKNELNRLTSNLKNSVDLLLKLKPAKKGV